MSHLKRKINIVVTFPDDKNYHEFQTNVNRVYLEMIKNRLKKSNLGTERSKEILDELIKNCTDLVQ